MYPENLPDHLNEFLLQSPMFCPLQPNLKHGQWQHAAGWRWSTAALLRQRSGRNMEMLLHTNRHIEKVSGTKNRHTLTFIWLRNVQWPAHANWPQGRWWRTRLCCERPGFNSPLGHVISQVHDYFAATPIQLPYLCSDPCVPYWWCLKLNLVMGSNSLTCYVHEAIRVFHFYATLESSALQMEIYFYSIAFFWQLYLLCSLTS